MVAVLSEKQKNDIVLIVTNFHQEKKHIPFVEDLQQHEVYGMFFRDIPDDEKDAIQDLIRTYIKDYLAQRATKGASYIARLMENESDLFWSFRQAHVDTSLDFNALGKDIEQHLFDMENLLTSRMSAHASGMNKTLDSFYDIVHAIFPQYHRVGLE